MSTQTSPIHSGQFILSEANGVEGRDVVKLEATTVALQAGTLLGRVTATTRCVPYSASASDGSNVVIGILYAFAPASPYPRPVTIVARDEEVDAAWLTGIDAAAVTGLLALGITVHGSTTLGAAPAPSPAPAPAPAPSPAPAPGDTRPRFGYAPANAVGDQAAFAALFATMTPLTGSANSGRAGTFSTVSSTTNYTWIAVLHSAAPNGIRVFDGTGYGGFSGATAAGIYGGADTDPLTLHGTYADGSGAVWDMYRSNGKASTFSTFTLS